MRRWKGLGGGRRSSFEVPKPVDDDVGSTVKARSGVHGVWRDLAPVFSSPRRSFGGGRGDRRRSVDDQRRASTSSAGAEGVVRRESEEKLLVEYQALSTVPPSGIGKSSTVRGIVMASRRSSFSSCTSGWESGTSSRPSDASSMQYCSDSPCVGSIAQCRGMRSVGGQGRAVVVAFDANARNHALAGAVEWAFLSVLKPGDELVLVGVLKFIRGPFGYKCQVNDQTWLGANRKQLQDEIALKTWAWSSTPGLQSMCEEHGVTLVAEVKPAQRPEVAVVQEAVAVGAVHVVLDKSLNNVTRGRKYYLDSLTCAVTRMRRSGGVEILRSSIPTSKVDVSAPASPSSVLPMSNTGRFPNRPPLIPSASLHRDDEEELFTIDHCRHGPRISIDDGYESDDLFSICGAETPSDRDPNVDSTTRLDNRLLSLTRLQIGD